MTEPHPQRSVFDVREWKVAEWIGALVGLLVALVLWTIWPQWPGRNVDNDVMRTVVNAIWFVGHIGVGFFGGALFGDAVKHRQRHS